MCSSPPLQYVKQSILLYSHTLSESLAFLLLRHRRHFLQRETRNRGERGAAITDQ